MRQIVAALLAGLMLDLTTSAGAASQPAVQGARDPIRVTSLNDGRFRFVQGSGAAVLNLRSSISGCTGSLYDSSTGQQLGGSVAARVLDEVQRAGFWYVLMQVDTNTGCNVQGMCGAGSSTDVIWLKLSGGLRAEARQAARVDDCASDTELTTFDGKAGSPDSNAPAQLETRGGVLSLTSTADDYTEKTTTTLRVHYDRRTPERGLIVSKSVAPLKP